MATSSIARTSVVGGFCPTVRTWFLERFGAPTDAQAAGWPSIMSGRDTLLAAPTGSGKTLAAVGTLGEANTELIKRVRAFQIGNPEVEECRQKAETAWRVHKRPTAPVRLLDPGKQSWTEFTLQTAATALDERFTTKLADGVV